MRVVATRTASPDTSGFFTTEVLHVSFTLSVGRTICFGGHAIGWLCKLALLPPNVIGSTHLLRGTELLPDDHCRRSWRLKK
jgi:hypothetical protein